MLDKKCVLVILITGVITQINLGAVQIIPWDCTTHDRILDIVQKYLPQNPVIVEAGAFDGADSVKMAELWPRGSVHAFEPDPLNFIKLKRKTSFNNNIYCYPLALSNKNGTALFYQSEDPDNPDNAQSGSLLTPKEHLNYSNVIFSNGFEVITMTLDAWAQENNVKQVDLLWLDTQGTELDIVKAAPNVLKKVKAIYTEVEFVEAYEGQALYNEVRCWLEDQGFVLIATNFNDSDKTRWYGDILMVRKEIIA